MIAKYDWWKEAIKDQRKFEAWLVRAEIPVARKIARSKNRMVAKISALYAVAPDSQFALLQNQHRDEVAAILRKSYARVIPVSAKRTLDSIRKLKAWGEYNAYFERLIAYWTVTQTLKEATTIAETTMNDVRRSIQRGLSEGLGIAVVARDIRKVTNLSPYRAATVARTEIHNAALYASEEISKQAQVDFGLRLMKFWIPTQDGRTRDAHAAMSRHPGVEMNQKFRVGGEMLSRPGDPAGSAATTINCRCSLVYRELEIDME